MSVEMIDRGPEQGMGASANADRAGQATPGAPDGSPPSGDHPLRISAKFWRAMFFALLITWFLIPVAERYLRWQRVDMTLDDGRRVRGYFTVTPARARDAGGEAGETRNEARPVGPQPGRDSDAPGYSRMTPPPPMIAVGGEP